MPKKTATALFLTLISLASPSFAQFAEQRVVTNICNSDGSDKIYYAVRDNDGLGGNVSGWYSIPPNGCKDVYRYTMDRSEHEFVFMWGETQADVFWTGQHEGGAFCVDPEDSFEYLENILNVNRSQNCQGGETLMRANYKMTYYHNVDDSLVIPPRSSEKGAETPHVPTPEAANKSDANDGVICSAFGVCLRWPPF